MKTVLVINSGSSSIKYQLIDVETQNSLVAGLVERIGLEVGQIEHTNIKDAKTSQVTLPIKDHKIALEKIMDLFGQVGPDLNKVNLIAVGHRVVQGGDFAKQSIIITPEVERTIEELIPLAPLHNPGGLDGIKAAKQAFPKIPHIAVFDTAFHSTMPDEARTYALPADLCSELGIKRYGFHGTSHSYVSKKLAKAINKPYTSINSIILHIGNGASISAVKKGKCIETSMGLTPLEGLVMGSRCGDIDPAIIPYICNRKGIDIKELDEMLNKKSGMIGLAGSSDLRDVDAKAKWELNSEQVENAGVNKQEIKQARLAIGVYVHRIKSYIGAYYAQLGKVDAIAWTAGVGENNCLVREKALEGLENLGIVIDSKLNKNAKRGECVKISTEKSLVEVWVIPTNEELQIAMETNEVVCN